MSAIDQSIVERHPQISGRWWLAFYTSVVLIAGSAGAIAYAWNHPTYTVTAFLRVLEPESDLGIEGDTKSPSTFDRFVQTQVRLLTTSKILSDTLTDKRVRSLERVRTSDDPEVDLRSSLKAEALPGTSLIAVSMTSANPTEAATIVNTVSEKYLNLAQSYAEEMTESSIKQLENLKSQLEEDITKQVSRYLTGRNAELSQADGQTFTDPDDGLIRRLRSELDDVAIARLKDKAIRDNNGLIDPPNPAETEKFLATRLAELESARSKRVEAVIQTEMRMSAIPPIYRRVSSQLVSLKFQSRSYATVTLWNSANVPSAPDSRTSVTWAFAGLISSLVLFTASSIAIRTSRHHGVVEAGVHT